MKFTNCAFVNNTTGTGLGGAIFINNFLTGVTADISFINTTFAGNQAGANTAGAIAVSSLLQNSKFNMINCTVSGNKVAGTSGASGAGLRFLKNSAASIRKIQNCIIENNTAVDANSATEADYADLGMEDVVDATDPANPISTPSYVPGTTLIIDKSIIGSCKNTDFATQFPTNNVNYVFALNGDIKNSFVAKLDAFNETSHVFPLLAGSPAIAYANTAYLKDLTPSIITDQLGVRRPWVNCSAGAFEYTNAAGLQQAFKGAVSIYRNASNQLVVKNNSAKAGQLSVYNMMGQLQASAAI